MIRTDLLNAIQATLRSKAYGYIDKDTFRFEFGEGKFADEDGDSYFFHVEYQLDNKKWIFEKWYEDEVCDAELTLQEKNYVKAVIKELL